MYGFFTYEAVDSHPFNRQLITASLADILLYRLYCSIKNIFLAKFLRCQIPTIGENEI